MLEPRVSLKAIWDAVSTVKASLSIFLFQLLCYGSIRTCKNVPLQLVGLEMRRRRLAGPHGP